MQTFQTAAIVSLMDQLSGPLSSLAGKISNMTRTMQGQMGSAQTGAIQQAERQMAQLESRFGNLAGMAATAVAAMSGNMVRSIRDVGLEMDRLMTRMEMFTDASRAAIRGSEGNPGLRQWARTEGNKYGGPQEALRGLHAAQTAGLNPEQAKVLTPYAHALTKDMGMPMETSAETLTQVATSMGLLRRLEDGVDSRGRSYKAGDVVSPEMASMPELKKGLQTALGIVKVFGAIAPGGTTDTLAMMKFVGPTLMATKQDINNYLAMAALLARAGIKGEEGGNALKMTTIRGLFLTNKGRAAAAAVGLNPNDYMDINLKTMSGETYANNLFQRTGKVAPRTKEDADKAFARARATGDYDKLREDLQEIALRQKATTIKNRAQAMNFVNDYIGANAGSIDVIRLLRALHTSSPEQQKRYAEGIGVTEDEASQAGSWLLGAMAKMFTAQQAGRLAAIDPNLFDEMLSHFKNANYVEAADGVVKAWQDSVSGAVERAKGAMAAMADSLFEPWEGRIKQASTAFAQFGESFTTFSDGVRQATGVFIAGAGALAAIYTAKWAAGLLGGLGKGAAVGAGTGAAVVGGAGVATKISGLAATGAVPLFAALGVGGGLYYINQANEKAFAGVKPGEQHDIGQARRRAYNQAFYERSMEERARQQRALLDGEDGMPRSWREIGSLPDQGWARGKYNKPAIEQFNDGSPSWIGNVIRSAIEANSQPGRLSGTSPMDVNVQGTVSGTAEVKSNVNVQVDVNEAGMRAFVNNIINERVPMLLNGAMNKLGQTMSGSNAPTPGKQPTGTPVDSSTRGPR